MKETVIKAVLSVVVTAFCTYIIAEIKNLHDKQKAQHEGLQSLLRTEIIKQYEKSVRRGYCPIYAKEVLEHNYIAYKKLGGNGIIDRIYAELLELPNEEPN